MAAAKSTSKPAFGSYFYARVFNIQVTYRYRRLAHSLRLVAVRNGEQADSLQPLLFLDFSETQ